MLAEFITIFSSWVSRRANGWLGWNRKYFIDTANVGSFIPALYAFISLNKNGSSNHASLRAKKTKRIFKTE